MVTSFILALAAIMTSYGGIVTARNDANDKNRQQLNAARLEAETATAELHSLRMTG